MKISPLSSRKPPQILVDRSSVDAWMQNVRPMLQPLVKTLDALICENIPGLQYSIKWGKLYYGLPKLGWIIELVAYDVSVNLVFLKGAKFTSPPPLGESDDSRYVKLKSIEDLPQDKIQRWILQASQIESWK